MATTVPYIVKDRKRARKRDDSFFCAPTRVALALRTSCRKENPGLDLARLWRRIPVKVHPWQERTNKYGVQMNPRMDFSHPVMPQLPGLGTKATRASRVSPLATAPPVPVRNHQTDTAGLAIIVDGTACPRQPFDAQGLPSHSWCSLLRTLTPIRDPPPSPHGAGPLLTLNITVGYYRAIAR